MITTTDSYHDHGDQDDSTGVAEERPHYVKLDHDAIEERSMNVARNLLWATFVVVSCRPMDRSRRADAPPDSTALTVDTAVASAPAAAPVAPPPTSLASRVLAVEGFLAPESVLHDTLQDVYFVSNIHGIATAKDNNGFISRMKPDGAVENLKFIEGGRSGVTLNAPKGLALQGDTLWVADIDVVRAFNAKTGAPIDSVSLVASGAVFLNDVAFALLGALYITDTGIRYDDVGNVLHPGPDRVFRIGSDRAITVAIRGDSLGWPNGIALDAAGRRFVIVSFGGKSVLGWKPNDKAPRVIARGAGGFDGVAIARGTILVSSWADSSVTRFDSTQGTRIISGLPGPADIGYDAKRNRVLVPLLPANRVEVWQLP